MIIKLFIENPNQLKTYNKLYKITYNILNKFCNTCPKEYLHVIPKLKLTPFIISIRNKEIKSFYGWADTIEQNGRIDEVIVTYDNCLTRFTTKQLRPIVAHELAHCIDNLIRGSDCPAHDKEWKKIVKLLGGQPSTRIFIN